MRLRSFIITFIALTLGIIFFACQRQTTQTAAPPPPAGTASTATTATGPNLEEIEVTIRATGLASLMEGRDPMKERILIFPKVSGHDLLLLVNNGIYTVTIPTTTAEQTDSAGSVIAKYNFAVYPSGFEIDLPASGWAPVSPKLEFTTTGDAQQEECPNDGAKNNISANSLHWLPKMSDVNKDAVTPKTSHVKKNPKASANVLAQVFITDGFLEAETKSRRKFKFGTGARSGDLQQVVADYLLFRFKAWVAPGQPFVLKGRKFNPTGAADQWQELVRVMPRSNKKVEITLANVVKKDFFKLKKLGTEITHFTMLYDVLDGPKKNIKKVTFVETCGSSGGEDGLECGPNRVP